MESAAALENELKSVRARVDQSITQGKDVRAVHPGHPGHPALQRLPLRQLPHRGIRANGSKGSGPWCDPLTARPGPP